MVDDLWLRVNGLWPGLKFSYKVQGSRSPLSKDADWNRQPMVVRNTISTVPLDIWFGVTGLGLRAYALVLRVNNSWFGVDGQWLRVL